MKKILFPFDLKTDNRSAFVYAAKLARKMQAELIMLNAYRLDISDDITDAAYRKMVQRQWNRAFEEVMRLKTYFFTHHVSLEGDLKLKFSYRFVHGKRSSEVEQILKSETVDLIVFSLHAEGEESRSKTGVVLKKVLDMASCPILVIPENEPYRGFGSITYATDFVQIRNGPSLVSYASDIAGYFDSQLHFVHVSAGDNHDNIKDKATLESILQLSAVSPAYKFQVLKGTDVIDRITGYVGENQTTLIIIVKKNATMLSAFFGGLTLRMSLTSRIPVMILRDLPRRQTP